MIETATIASKGIAVELLLLLAIVACRKSVFVPGTQAHAAAGNQSRRDPRQSGQADIDHRRRKDEAFGARRILHSEQKCDMPTH